MPPPSPKITVVGSLNIDLIAVVEELPGPGQTVPARALLRRFGGKGANQAVAAERQGAAVSMIGCVGDDADGRNYCGRLRSEGIGTIGTSTKRNVPTGMALIAVDHEGENLIIVAPGANGELTPANVRRHDQIIRSARILLLQFEVPLNSVMEAVRIANKAGVPVVLNPSPARAGFPWNRCRLDSVIVNAGEAKDLFNVRLANLRKAQQQLSRLNIGRLIITRGAKPTICLARDSHFEVPTLAVRPLDTVGAGDAFAGAYAARRADGADVRSAIRYANCAGALATLKPGAQEAIPYRSAVRRVCESLKQGP